MLGKDMISRHEHDLEISKLARRIERMNAELSALAAYLITAGPTWHRSDPDRAADLAAKMGRITKREAEERIKRIDDALRLCCHA
jgi:hypothetical protein